MRTLLLATTLALAIGGGMQSRPAAGLDPAGKWTYSTRDEQGSTVSGTMTISGKPGAYTGTISVGEGQGLPITDVLVSSSGMVMLATLQDGGTAMIRITKKADGTLDSGWAPVRNMIPATIERAK
jgi:hypothetical protein